MKHSESLTNLAAALVKAQGELRAVQKDSVNPHFKNTYASLDTILDTVRPVLKKHDLALVQGATTPHTDESGRVTSFTVETMLLHASGEYIINAAAMPLAKSDPQGAGGAITYGRRYGLSALLALATEEDDDGNVASPRPAASAPRPPARQTPPAQSQPASIAEVVQAVEAGLGDKVVPSCPTCGGAMWDNRVGKKNPKAPDFKCKDKACDGVVWPPRDNGAKKPAPKPAPSFEDESLPYPPEDHLPF